MDEPSLLDYLKEKAKPRNWFRKLEMDQQIEAESNEIPAETLEGPTGSVTRGDIRGTLKAFPWIPILAVLFALVAQNNLEPARRHVLIAVVFYFSSVCLLLLSLLKGQWQPAPLPAQASWQDRWEVRKVPFYLFLGFLLLTFFSFSGNLFTWLNLTFWLATIATGVLAFWQPGRQIDWEEKQQKLMDWIRAPKVKFSFNWWEVLLLGVLLLAGYFRFYQLNSVPNEMISDQVEKLLDVNDVLNGQTSIFFYRNTGREAFQFYLTALVARLFGTGVSFLSLKLGTALMGMVTLVYLYRLGKELGNRWVGLLAVLLMGIAYWPNVITRIGLRFTLYPLFVAPMLFYLLRGLRRMKPSDFILAGAALGLGLQGYSPYRIVPFLVGIIIIVYLLHNRDKTVRMNAIWGFLLVALFSLVLFLPLARYWTENPESFGFRALTRLGSTERPLPGPPLQIFLSNFWNASIMPFWNNGNVWAHSIPFRPALDVVSAAFYLLGVAGLIFRYFQKRTWQDLSILLSIPVLLMPSILSLAFPEENPALNRTAGAAVPIFLVAAIALEGFLAALWRKVSSTFGRVLVTAGGLLLILMSMSQNHDLVFRQYAEMYRLSSWNTSQIGEVVKEFVEFEGNENAAWVVGIPHWVDTRAVGINSGFPASDYAIWPEDFETTLTVPAPKLFIVRADDQVDIDLLKTYYPTGYLVLHSSPYEGKSFYSFVVPPADGIEKPLD